MTDDTVTIEVDGRQLKARKGQMLIEVTDANDIYVPRFCYHPKLTVAANCRMCLVQVEKAPKPLPACATPVMDGMKVSTRSAYARDAQKSVMEFLLINHPLDCPICDQGGECELQDLAMGFGSDVSRYNERKRVVRDKNIGPLVQTDMTRCIHCTRCVRFGEEIAGLRELGATGRGEFMEIGTYIEKSMVSELSGNVIDVCPVGALTSKPFRFKARAWEMTQHPGVAPHDGTGSNVDFHVSGERVMRVVPGENEAINEVWLSDRDRFSYEGLYSPDRLASPMVKQDGTWREVEWEVAFDRVVESVRAAAAGQAGALVSPAATTEEAYLLQRIMRGLGSGNIDHRTRQQDFSDPEGDPVFPWLGRSIEELQTLDAALVIGGNPRKQQPLLNLRLRKASLKGGGIMMINPLDYELNYLLAARAIGPDLVAETAAVLKALEVETGRKSPAGDLLVKIQPGENHREIARGLAAGKNTAVLAGNLFQAHPAQAALRFLAGHIAALSGATFGYLGGAANEAGAWLAGAVPHRGPGGGRPDRVGLDAAAMLEQGLPLYLLFNLEPDLDFADPRAALTAMRQAGTVIAFTAFKTAALAECADVMLPIALFAENEGSFVNAAGTSQAFRACVPAPGEARPAWKILRVLASRLGIAGCDYEAVREIQDEIAEQIGQTRPDNGGAWQKPATLAVAAGVTRIADVPMNAGDPLVRQARALQQTVDVADGLVHINPAYATSLKLGDGDLVRVQQAGEPLDLPYVIDETVPDKAVLIHGAHPVNASLGPGFGDITLRKA